MNSTYIVALIILFSAYVCLLVGITIKRGRKNISSVEVLAPGRSPTVVPEIVSELPKAKLELEIELSKDADTGLYRAVTNIKNPDPGEHYSFAFYLLADRKQIDVRWHEHSPTFEFMFPDGRAKIEIVAFVKNENGDTFTEKKEIKRID
ncbi:hypothetical protein W822_04210 [Advenella kashmirensis W13003]|uniref:Uncharacterized protein n=1 Tax=Advenella kashmirensis W13003 TaxID=1424334 RepID=V8QZH3_9BURK|nr:hypothetical protein [Advenella kashmirensis]ETF04725.1 hypothetical protein W822_04210 [Advenella kashmirensis W13003]